MEYEYIGTFQKHSEEDSCGWNFLFMPRDLAKEIRVMHKHQEEGWGRMKVTAKIGNTQWKTSIWFDTKNDGTVSDVGVTEQVENLNMV